MLDSAPIPLQAILWPLLGAIVLLIAGRLLPNWLRRFVALLAAGGSLSVLWPLRTMDTGRVEFFWEPLNLFRTSPTLQSDGLMVLAGLSMGIMTAACVLGIAGAKPQSTPFHGLALVALSGGMIVTMGVNLVTLALGSALIDLTLIAMAVSVEQDGKVSWRTVLPGLLSTLLLFGAALRMNTQVGSASLQAKVLPDEVAVVLGVAGLLRLIVLALPPRAARTPEHAALLILPTAVGLYLLARIQLLAPIHVDQPWMVAVGSVLLAIGGFLSWTALVSRERRWQGSGGQERSEADPATVRSGGDEDAPDGRMLAADAATVSDAGIESRVEPQPSLLAGAEDTPVYKGGEMSRGTWPGLSAHQVGLALCFVLLLGGTVPWPLLGLPFTLGILVIWWDASLERQHGPRPGWVDWIVRRLSRIEDQQEARSEADDAAMPRPFAWAWIRVVSIVPAIVALAARKQGREP